MTTQQTAFARKRQAATSAILDATSQIIAESGVEGFTMSQVADRAKINRSLIYHYFHDRENLVLQAIRHIVHQYDEIRPNLGPDAIEQNARMHIEHPEIGRFFFQLLLTGRPIPSFAQRMLDTMEDLRRFKAESAPNADFDPDITVLIAWLSQLSWSFSRNEIARQLGLSVEVADARFIANLRRASRIAIETITRGE
jgi:AcrR family transcriptional regulator